MSYALITDSSADLPWSYYREHDVPFIPLLVNFGENTYPDDGRVSSEEFFGRLSAGEVANTTQITQDRFFEFFEPFLQQGRDILYVGLTLGLSATYDSACLARARLLEKYPERRIELPESTCVSLGLGFLVDRLRRLRDGGADIDALVEYTQRVKLKVHHRFTVDDLMFLHRGGRVSRTSAVVGSLLGIKPMLHVSPEGKLLNHGKVRGRRASLLTLAADCIAMADRDELGTVAISHGNCKQDAEFVIEEIRKQLKIDEVILHDLGCTIGAHAGNGTVALFFFGKERTE
ncbi:MAG: DegV family protein [Oscillospiraceae bacterium]|jgi:DegV family protein with EDD domain|nr:DegV family protein [Oscillospiraceae bacterium]